MGYKLGQSTDEVQISQCQEGVSGLVDDYKKPSHFGQPLKDSGERRTFSTGAQRDRGHGKGKPSLVPGFVIWLVSRIYEDGAIKYTDRNWEKGMPLSEYIDSAERHLQKLKDGLRDEPHASQVIWNMIGYIFTATMIKLKLRDQSLNNMPNTFTSTVGENFNKAEPLSQHEYSSLETYLGQKL